MQRGNRLKHWLLIPSGPCVNRLPEEPAFTPCWFVHRRNYLLFKCLMTFVALLVFTDPNIFMMAWSYDLLAIFSSCDRNHRHSPGTVTLSCWFSRTSRSNAAFASQHASFPQFKVTTSIFSINSLNESKTSTEEPLLLRCLLFYSSGDLYVFFCVCVCVTILKHKKYHIMFAERVLWNVRPCWNVC